MCRSRKVKCDETKPTCRRCMKANQECQYRDDSELYFRNQTSLAAQRAEEGWRKRSAKSQNNRRSGESSEPDPDQLSLPATQHLTLDKEIKTDLYRLAYNRFLFDFVIPNNSADHDGPRDGFLGFLPSFYEQSSPDSCLFAAVSAVSFANFDGRFKSPEAKLLGSEYCGKALKLIQHAIQDYSQAKSDETLFAVYLLGIYENLTTATYNGSWIAHKRGAVALISLRDPQQYNTPNGARLFDLVYVQMLMACFSANEEPPGSLENWADLIHSNAPGLSVPGIRLTKVVYETAIIWAQWRNLKSMQPRTSIENNIEAQLLAEKARALDMKFQAWEDALPDLWKFQSLKNTPNIHANFDLKWVRLLLDHPGAPPTIHIYGSLKRAFAWNFYRTSRLFLNRVLLDLNDTITSPPSSDHSMAVSTGSMDCLDAEYQITRLTEDVSASILCHFTVQIPSRSNLNSPDDVCGMRGYVLLWPLVMIDNAIRAGVVKGVDTVSRRDWIKRILLYLHDDLGIARARAAIRANHEASYMFSPLPSS